MDNGLYPVPAKHDPQYWIVDGRHRWCGAVLNNRIKEFRCDVIDADGRHGLHVIPIEKLVIDPEVQFDFAYSEVRANRLARNWNERKVGVLTVVPIKNALPVAERSDIKLGLDRDRRHVSSIESFIAARQAGEEEAMAISSVVEAAGFRIGKIHHPEKDLTTISAVAVLRQIYNSLGKDGLHRAMVLNTHWKGEKKSTSGMWLLGLSLLIRDGYDQAMTPAAWDRWQDVVPTKIIRTAQGASVTGDLRAVAYEIAGGLRRKARLHQRPVVTTSAKDAQSRPI